MCSLSVLAFAIGNNDGWSRSDAIDFNWDGYHAQLSGSLLWYNVDIARIKAQQDPTLVLYITNLSETDSSHVAVQIYLGTSNTSLAEYEMDLAPGQFRIISRNAQAVQQLSYPSVQIKLKATSKNPTIVALSGKSLETSRIDETCKDGQANTLVPGATEPLSGTANQLKWFNVSLVEYIGQSAKGLRIITTPTEAAQVTMNLSYDCPCTGSTEYVGSATPTKPDTLTISGAVLEAIQELHAYVSVRSTKNFSIRVDTFDAAPVVPVPALTITPIEWDAEMPLGAANQENWFSLPYDSLVDDLIVPQLILQTSDIDGATFHVDLAYQEASGSMVILQEEQYTTPGKKLSTLLDVNIPMAMKASFRNGLVYYRVSADKAASTFRIRLSKVSASADCGVADDMDMAGGTCVSSSLLYERIYKVDMTYFTAAQSDGNYHDWKVQVINRNTTASNTIKGAIVNCRGAISESAYKSKTLAPGEMYERVVRYSELAAFGDELYVSIKSTGDYCIRFEEDAIVPMVNDGTCANKTIYDWSYGHNLSNDTTDAWYLVDLDTIANTTALPILTFQNNGTANATVRVEYAYECPVRAPLAAAEVYTIAPGRTATKQLSREQLIAINDASKPYYIKISATQPISWQIYLKNDNELASKMCEQALPFNWVSGNTQVADTTLWYKIDLGYAAKDKKTVQVHIDNLGSATATAEAKLAFACPYTSLSDYSASIPAASTRPARGSKSGRIPYAMYKENEAVWVRLTANQPVHVWAELFDAPTDTIWDCSKDSVGTIEGVIDSTYILTKDTAWFWFDTKQMRDPLIVKDTTYVPMVTITNMGTCADTLYAEMAFECPVAGEMMNRSIVLQPGKSYTNQLEADMVDNYVEKYEDIYLRLISHTTCGAPNLKMTMTMVDPNKGEDCYHAIGVLPCDTLEQKAGEHWYKLDVNTFRGSEVSAKLMSLATTSQTVTMAVYAKCDASPLESATRKMSAGASYKREIGELLSGLKLETVYLQLISTDKLALAVCIEGDLPPVEPIDICDSTFVKIEPNITYHQEAGDSVWYKVDLAYLDSMIAANALLVIQTDTTGLCPGNLKLKAKQYWDCNSTIAPTVKSLTVPADSIYTRLVMHDAIRSIGEPYAYIQITGDKCFDFTLEAILNRGDICERPIEFDWTDCNALPAGDTLWYHVSLDTLSQYVDSTGHSTKDLLLTITNLAADSAHMSAVEMKFGCGDKSQFDFSSVLAGYATKEKIVDYSLLKALGVDSAGLLMRVISDQPIRICVDTIAEQRDSVVYDTLTIYNHPEMVESLCWSESGALITNPYDGNFSFIQFDGLDTTFVDTVGFRYNFTFHGDSIRTYDIHFMRFAEFNEPIDSVVLPLLQIDPGMPLDSAYLAQLLGQLMDTSYRQNYDSTYQMSYTLMLDSVASSTAKSDYKPNGNGYAEWSIGTFNSETGKYENFKALADTFFTSPFAKEEIGLQVRYKVAHCGDAAIRTDTLVIAFTDSVASVVKNVSDTLCAGEALELKHINKVLNPDTSYIINADTLIRDTVYYFDTIAPSQLRMRDTIYVHNVVLYGKTVVLPDAAYYPVLKAGTALDTTAFAANIVANFAAANNGAVLTLTEVKYSEDKGATYKAANELSSTTLDSVSVVYVGTTNCAATITDTLKIAVAKADTLLMTINKVLCYNETFTTRSDHVITADKPSQNWSDTIHNAENPAVPNKLYDSIYVYNITTVVPVQKDTTAAFCKGESFIWEGHEAKYPAITEAGVYLDTLKTALGCDSVWCKLTLSENQPSVGYAKVEICENQLPYTWRGKTYTTAGDYPGADTLVNYLGCDSVITLQLTVFNTQTRDKGTIDICQNELPYWWKPDVLADSVRVLTAGEKTTTVYKKVGGCDSIIYKANFVILPVKFETVNETACDSYEWHGQVYTATGSYTDTLTSLVNGCDSIVTLNLTINKTQKTNRTVFLCKGETTTLYDGAGKPHVYSAACKDTLMFTTYKGCDSLDIVTIQMADTFHFVTPMAICEGDAFPWRGHTYSQAGSYFDRFTTIHGCDSVYELKLTVNPTYEYDVYDTICYKTQPSWYSGVITADGIYTESLKTRVTKCDSTIHHHVTVRTTPVLPDITDLSDKLPVFICGEKPVWYGDAGKDTLTKDAKKYFFETLPAMNPVNERVAENGFVWEISWDAGNTWTDLAYAGVCPANGKGWLRYRITTECGQILYSRNYPFEVVPGSTDNIYNVYNIPAFAKYDYWLLMINLKVISQKLGYTPTQMQVRWYRLVGDVDPIGPTGWPEGDDMAVDKFMSNKAQGSPLAGYGYYLAANTVPFSDDYYAVIANMDSVKPGECATVVRTDIVRCRPELPINVAGGNPTAGANNVVVQPENGEPYYAPYIAPTAVVPGGTVYVYNLNADLPTSIEVFSMMGERVDAISVHGETMYQYQAPATAEGFFLMKISSEQDTRSLKFVIK